MIFNLNKVFVALAAVTAATATAVSRQTASAACDFVLKPDVAVDSSSTNLVAEFNYVIGRSLAVETGSTIFNGGSTFTENADNTFNVHDDVEVEGKTAAETAAVVTGWVGETKQGLAANWLVESVTCA